MAAAKSPKPKARAPLGGTQNHRVYIGLRENMTVEGSHGEHFWFRGEGSEFRNLDFMIAGLAS